MDYNNKIKNLLDSTLNSSEDDVESIFKNFSYDPIFGITSNKLSSLNQKFIPIASHILKFIKHWVSENKGYQYEIICTKRSWNAQKDITGDDSNEKNGLSWYLYGNAISINVYSMTSEPFSDNDDGNNGLKKTINGKDKSSIKFIKDAQKWFSENLLNGNVLKIYGVFENSSDESLESCKNDPYVVYWGGIFDLYTNETHWEWHPGYKPNDIATIRENYLNNAFIKDSRSRFFNSLEDIFDFESLCIRNPEFAIQTESFTFLKSIKNNVVTNNISNYNEGIVLNTYLNTIYEIIAEDYIGFYKLKSKINKLRQVSFFDIFKWANANPDSLDQTILYYKIVGDGRTRSFFEKIKGLSDSIEVKDGETYYLGSHLDEDFESPYKIGDFELNRDEEGELSINVYDEFGRLYSISGDKQFILPSDKIPNEDDFNVIDFDDEDIFTLNDFSTINSEIQELAEKNSNIEYDFNENGALSDISFNSDRLKTLDELKSEFNVSKVFEEMITPPNQAVEQKEYKSSGVIDLNYYKKIVSNKYVDEMITPDNIS